MDVVHRYYKRILRGRPPVVLKVFIVYEVLQRRLPYLTTFDEESTINIVILNDRACLLFLRGTLKLRRGIISLLVPSSSIPDRRYVLHAVNSIELEGACYSFV